MHQDGTHGWNGGRNATEFVRAFGTLRLCLPSLLTRVFFFSLSVPVPVQPTTATDIYFLLCLQSEYNKIQHDFPNAQCAHMSDVHCFIKAVLTSGNYTHQEAIAKSGMYHFIMANCDTKSSSTATTTAKAVAQESDDTSFKARLRNTLPHLPSSPLPATTGKSATKVTYKVCKTQCCT